MKQFLTRLFQRIAGIAPTPNKTVTLDPHSLPSVSKPPPTIPTPAATLSPEQQGSQSVGAEAATSGGTTQRPLVAPVPLSCSGPQDPRALLVESMAQAPLLAQVLLKTDPAKLDDEQIKRLLEIFQDEGREQILRNLYDRKEESNRCSSSSPIGGR